MGTLPAVIYDVSFNASKHLDLQCHVIRILGLIDVQFTLHMSMCNVQCCI